MNDEIYNIQAIPGQPLRDQFADIGALSCMLADALEEHREGEDPQSPGRYLHHPWLRCVCDLFQQREPLVLNEYPDGNGSDYGNGQKYDSDDSFQERENDDE